jgi:hypothetical protein
MQLIAKRMRMAIAGGAAVVAVSVAGVGPMSGTAYAAGAAPCNNATVHIWWHPDNAPARETCLANNQTWLVRPHSSRYENWLTEIVTGHHEVQWFGDGRWQPAGWIHKRTVFDWPNHPGGVSFTKIRIRG